MVKSIRWALAVVVAAAAVVAGCGGGDDDAAKTSAGDIASSCSRTAFHVMKCVRAAA